jgi:hypothetical protein
MTQDSRPNWYVRFRSGRASLWVVAVGSALWAIETWLAATWFPWLPHFDNPDLGHLTAILSVEASVMSSWLLAYMQQNDGNMRLQIDLLVELAHAQRDTLKVVMNHLLIERRIERAVFSPPRHTVADPNTPSPGDVS